MLTGAVLTAATSAAARLRERGESVAVAESSTGGLIAAALVAQDGASRYFRGGFVFYTLESMATQLADASDVEFGERSATEQRARWVADSARARLAADWGVGETGRTVPGPTTTAIPPAIVGSQPRGPTGSCPRTCTPATATVWRTWRP